MLPRGSRLRNADTARLRALSSDARHPPLKREATMRSAPHEHHRELRIAARALARGHLVHAYGHCSLRLDADHFLVCAAKPMGTITPDDDGTVVPVSGALPEGVLGEVRIHQQIYARRPDVGAVCRIMPPQIGVLALLKRTPKPRHGFGAYFAPGPACGTTHACCATMSPPRASPTPWTPATPSSCAPTARWWSVSR